jgi:hypothetical protein
MGLPYDLDKQNNGDSQTAGPKFIIDTLSESPHNSANEFNFQLQSGKLKFVNIQAKLSGSFPVDKFLVPNTWKTRFQIDNSKKLTIQRPIFITRLEDDVVFIPEEIKNLEYEIEFEHITTTPATSSAFLTSYADVTFGNLRTFSGDVNKVKLFGRQKDKQNAEFEKFGEFILETKNELKDSTSITGDDPVGIFYSQSVVDNFWQSSSAAQPIEIDNTQIMNAVLVSGSNYADGNFVEFKTKNQFELEKNEEYIVSFQSYYIKKNKQQADGSVRKSAEIEVFLSGSVISQTGGTLSLGSVSDSGDNASELLKGNVSGSIPRLYNYFTTHKKSGIKPKAGLIFRVNAGEFYISNVKLEPVSDRNFNPGFYKTIVPMPIGSRRGQRYDFVSEFYDSNNNKADFEAVTSASVAFAGAPQVLADGTDAVLSGSVQIGNSMQMYGVNPAFLRSIGYDGFNKTIAGTGDRNGGFMLWSGSIGSTIGASETYNGVGLEVVDASSTNKHEHAFLQFASNYKGTGNPRFRVQTNEFLLGVSGSGAAETFISGSQGKLRISSSNFHLDDDGAVTMQGTITAAAGGTIGGFTIGSDNLTATNFVLNTTDKSLSLGSGNSIFIADADTGIQLGHATFGSAPFRVTPAGVLTATSATIQGAITATSGEIGNFNISSTGLSSDSGEFQITGSTGQITGSKVLFTGGKIGGFEIVNSVDAIRSVDKSLILSGSGQITGSSVLFTGGKIGGFELSSTTLSATNFTIDTSGKSISLGSGNNVFIADADSGIQLGHATFGSAPFRVSPTGALTATSATIQGAVTATSGDIGGFNIDSTTLFSDSKEFVITGSTGQITGSKVLFTGGKIGGFSLSSTALTGTNFSLDTDGKRITLGTGTDIFIADADEGIQLGNSTFANAPFSVTKAGVLKAEQGFIGGFAINSGSIETNDFASGLKGLRLSTAANGTIEAENARIRGTLATTVFEKETVNAVGGQLLVANSTAITSSVFHSKPVSASQTTMSVVNVTGFVANEILLIKKVGDTGFSTEYVKVVSASRDAPSSDKNFSGRLFVNRAINSGSMSSAGMFMESGSSAQQYEDGQVVVSTGKIGTGFIKLNANPNDIFTPYIDIVERTGSAVYDIDLKARLGDLSGLSSTLVGSDPGFGLFSENVFLTGKITATSGEIGGFTIDGHSLTTTGVEINDSTQPLFINTSNFDVSHTGNVTASNVDLSGKITATSGEIGGLTIGSSKVHVGTGTHGNSNTAFYVDDSGKFSLKDKLVWDGSTLNIDGTLSVGSLPDNVVSSSAQLASDISGSSAAGLASLNAITGSILDKTGSIDLQVARVVIHNAGMYLRNQGGDTLASYGSSIALGTSGSNEENILIDGSSVDIRSGTTSLADFGSTVRIGKSGQARTEITDTTISMYDGQGTPRKRVAINNAGVIAVGGASGADVAVDSTDEVVRIDSSGVNIFNDSDNFTFVSGSGMSVFSGGDKVAQFASEVKIGDFEDATKSFVKIDGDSLDIMAGTTVTASFGATTTIGNTATEHVSISSTELKLKDGNGGGTDIDYVTINSSGMQIGDDITISTAGASSLSIGGLANVTDIGDASKGFLVDSSGNVLIKQGGANKNYMQFNSGVIDLQSDTFNLVTTGSGAGEDGGIIINSAQPQIMVSGSGTTSGNSVRLLGDEGVIEVSQSGAGVFDTGRTKTFTTTNIIEPDIFKPGARAFTTESITTTSLPSPTSENMFITSNLSVGNVLETDGFLIDTTSANTPFSIIQKVSRVADANLNDGASQPTASFAVVQENNFSGESSATNNNCHPGFVFQADYYTELETADNSIGWVQGSVPSGSNIFTIGTKLTGVEAADFEDAKFNILGLEANTAGIGNTTKENQYTFLQAKHSSSIRLQIQHDGDIVSKGNITAFGTSFLTVSDKREKKDICTISESLDRILELRPTKFTWKKTDKQDVGFIAQEVEKIIPEAIEISRGFINTDNDQERKTISYPKLVPYLVDTIQVLTKRIEELEKKVK